MSCIKNKTFTIITPCYNQGKLLYKTAKSIIGQNYETIQHIIVACKKSNDRTVEIANELSCKCPHITLLFDDGRNGPEGAYNLAFPKIKGDIIVLLGAGDFLEPNALSIVNKEFLKGNIEFVCGNAYILNNNQKRIAVSPMFKPSWKSIIFGGMIIRTEAVFFSHNSLKKAGAYLKETPASDHEIFSRILYNLNEKNIIYINKTLSNFLLHDGQNSSSGEKQNQAIYNVKKEFIKQHNISHDEYIEQSKHYIKEVRTKLIEFAKNNHQPYLFFPDYVTFLQDITRDVPYNNLLEDCLKNIINELHEFEVIYIYGAGQHTRRLLNYLAKESLPILGIIDDNPKTKFLLYNNTEIPIIFLKEIENESKICIVISSDMYEREIYNKISHLTDIKIIRIYEDGLK